MGPANALGLIGSSSMTLVMGVGVMPSATALTRMPSGDRSSAVDRVSTTRPCLVATYAKRLGTPSTPAVEVTLTSAPEPPAFTIVRATARVVLNGPVMFTARLRPVENLSDCRGAW